MDSKKATEQNAGVSVITLPRPGLGLASDGKGLMRTMAKGLLVTLALVLVGFSAAPAQARFFFGPGFYPGFYRPFPVFYRPYFVPPPPPPPVYVTPRPAVIVEPRPPVIVEPPPVVYRSVHYRYSRPVVWHHRHRVVHRRFCNCRLG